MFLLVLLLLVALCHGTTVKESGSPCDCKFKDTPASMAELLKLKCQALPYRSLFDEAGETCYVAIPRREKCSNINFPFVDTKSTNNRNVARRLGASEDNEGTLCTFRIAGECDGQQVGAKCINVVDKKVDLETASEKCYKQFKSTLYVAHSDRDIQEVMGILSESKENSFWIGASKICKKWWFHDSSIADFFRWMPNTAFQKKPLSMVLWNEAKKNSYLGYTTAELVDKKHAYICSKAVGNEYVVESKVKRDFVHWKMGKLQSRSKRSVCLTE